MLASRLLALPVRTAEADPRTVQGSLLPGEESAVENAVLKRRQEFIAGRVCARRAMADLGEPGRPIFQGKDRAPIWPAGLVGSIAHTDDWCVAAVARVADGIRALGLDVEPAAPIEDKLLRIICLPDEREFLSRQPHAERGLMARLIFSAKECAYKCQYALSGKFLDFHAMRIDLDRNSGDFRAVFKRDAKPFSTGEELRGRFLIENGHMMTAIALTTVR